MDECRIETYMKSWDTIRELLVDEGCEGSLPRDIFENIISNYEEDLENLQSRLDQALELVEEQINKYCGKCSWTACGCCGCEETD
jgi:hypothetical protein